MRGRGLGTLTPNFPCGPNWVDGSFGHVVTTKHVDFFHVDLW